MNKIILDHFRRRWLQWTLSGLLFVGAGLVLAIERDIRISGVLCVSISIITLDLGCGCPRVLLSLPFTARQLGRAYWWLSVVAPTLLFAISSGVGILILKLAGTQGRFLGTWFQMFIATGPQDKFLGIWLETALAGGLLGGFFFWLMSGAIWGTALSRGGPRRKLFLWKFYACAFAIVLAGGIYLLCKSTLNITDKVVIAYVFGLVFSVLGWFRAESLFVDTSSRRDAAGGPISQGKFTPRPGYGGVSYLIIRPCLFYLSVVALLIAVVIAVNGIAARQDHRPVSWPDAVSTTLAQVHIWLFLMCLVQTMMVAPHLRFLRSLPLTSRKLAAIILCMALLPVLIIGGLWFSFFLIKPEALSAVSVLKCFLLELTPICVLVTGVVWYNERHFTRITGVVLAWIISMIPFIYQLATNRGGNGLPLGIIIALPILSLLIALFTINRLLERNEMTYRINFDLVRGR
jgi:hypothetical protein